MKEKEIKKRGDKIWKTAERQLGSPIPEVVRDHIEESLSLSFSNDENFLEDLEATVERYVDDVRIYKEAQPDEGNGRLHQAKIESGNTRRPNPKFFERRLRLVKFVADQVLTMVHLVYQTFSPHGRIKWGPVCDKWNKAHPYDLMTPVTLKGEYYHAIAKQDIRREYFRRMEGEIAPFRENILRLTATEDLQELMRSPRLDPEEACDILCKVIQAHIQKQQFIKKVKKLIKFWDPLLKLRKDYDQLKPELDCYLSDIMEARNRDELTQAFEKIIELLKRQWDENLEGKEADALKVLSELQITKEASHEGPHSQQRQS